MSKLPETPCDFAKLRYFSALRWLNLWKILLYAFGVAVVLFLVAAILLFIRSTWLAGAITTLGTIVSGGGIAWVVNQKKSAAADEKDAFGDLKQECGPRGMGLIGMEQQPWLADLRAEARRSLGLPGKWFL